MSTWAGIVRVSHMGKRKADAVDFHSERLQVEAIRREAASRGVEVDILPSELDVSGGTPLHRRPSMLRAIEGVETGRYAGIIAYDVNRFGRNIKYDLTAWERVEAARGIVVTCQEKIDTSTPDGRMQRNLLMAIGTAERERHAERFDGMRKWATEAGVWQSKPWPRGYDRDDTTRSLVPGADADEVRAAFRDRAAGVSYASLAKRLGMTPTGVRRMLSNRVYLGELHSGQYVNPAAHPALVDEDTFEAAQRKTARPPRSKAFDGPALLTGIVRCSGCGHVMPRSSGNAYKCPRFHGGSECPAPAAVFAPKLDEYANAVAVSELAKLHVSAAEGNGAERAKADHEAAKQELDAYLSATSALGNVEAFAAGAASRQAAVDATYQQWQAEVSRKRAASPDLLDPYERNALMRSLFAAVIVERVGRGRKIPVEQRARVLAIGTPLATPQRSGSRGAGIVPLPLPDFDQPGVLRVALGEDELQGAGGRHEVLSH